MAAVALEYARNMSVPLRIYHQAPYFARVLLATARGCYLRWWRYGPETERLIEEAREREAWSAARWKAWQEERLEEILELARCQVPYYREYWNAREKRGERGAWKELAKWPVLTKDVLRKNPEAFLSDNVRGKRLFKGHTSGSTGTPLTLYSSRETLRRWYALYEARIRGWHGVSIRDRWAIMGGQLVTPVEQKKPPYWVRNLALNQLYLSSYHVAPATAEHYVKALHRFQPTHLVTYPSALEALADEMLERGMRGPRSLRVIISNAEPLFERQRQKIEAAFGCRVRNTYGMGEIVGAACECPAGQMHLFPEVGWIEVLQDECNEPCEPGSPGRLVWTGLLRQDMVFVRYEVGDRGTLEAEGTGCECGRGLPILKAVEGRLDDVVVTPDGRRVGRLDTAFKMDLPIRRAQIIQETVDQLSVLVEPDSDYDQAVEEDIKESLRAYVGSEMTIEVQQVDRIPLSANGKFRMVVSKVARSAPRGVPTEMAQGSGTGE